MINRLPRTTLALLLIPAIWAFAAGNATNPATNPATKPATSSAPTVLREITGVSFEKLALRDESGRPLKVTHCLKGPKGVDYFWGGGLYSVSQPGIAKTLIGPGNDRTGSVYDCVFDGRYIWVNLLIRIPKIDLTSRIRYLDTQTGKSYQLTEKDWELDNFGKLDMNVVKPGMIVIGRAVGAIDGTSQVDLVTATDTGAKVDLIGEWKHADRKKNRKDWESTDAFFWPSTFHSVIGTDPASGKATTLLFISRQSGSESDIISDHDLVLDIETRKLTAYPFVMAGLTLSFGDTGYEWEWSIKNQAYIVYRHHMSDKPDTFVLPKDAQHPIFYDGRTMLIGQHKFWVGTELGRPFTEYKTDVWTQTDATPCYSNHYGILQYDIQAQGMFILRLTYAK